MPEFDVQPAMDSRPASPHGRQTTVYLAGELLLKSMRDSLEIEQHKERLEELSGKLQLAERRLFMAEHEAGALKTLAKLACSSIRRAERAEERFGLAEERARLAEAEASRAAQRGRLAEAEASQAVERERLAETRASQAEERARLAEAEASRVAERERLAEARASQAAERERLAEARASQAAERERLAEARASREEVLARLAEAEASQAEKKARFAEAKASQAEERARLAEARASRAEEGRKIAEEDVRSAEERAWQKGKQAMEAEEKIRRLQDKMQTLETELAEARRQIKLASHRSPGHDSRGFVDASALPKWSAQTPETSQSSTLLNSSSTSESSSPPGFPIVWRFPAHVSDTDSSQSPTEPSLQGAVSGAVARGNGATSPSSLPSTYVWDLADLKPFTASGGPTILGSGCYGTVYLHRHRSSGTPIAVKTMILPDCPRAMEAKVQKIAKEASLLDLFGREEFFPRYLGCVEVRVGCVGLAMEFVGDPKTGKTFTVGKAIAGHVPLVRHADWLQIALDLARGLQVIHNKGYLMNDLKGDNALIYMPPTSHRWRAKIIDFGLVTSRSDQNYTRFCRNVKEKYRRGQIYRHIAPEVALQDQPKSVHSDVFQLGRLLWAMGMSSGDRDLTDIGDACRSSMPVNRPAVDAVVDELRMMMNLFHLSTPLIVDLNEICDLRGRQGRHLFFVAVLSNL